MVDHSVLQVVLHCIEREYWASHVETYDLQSLDMGKPTLETLVALPVSQPFLGNKDSGDGSHES